jgi:mono/diheme cytochrome c family protein
MMLTSRFSWAALLGASLAVTVIQTPTGAADDPVTFYEHVAPILRANCVSCHQSAGQNLGGLLAPMALTTYEDVRPWTRSMARKVKAREMPPWFADEPKGVFANERGLTDKEIATIVAWVDAGAPAGDKAKAPPAPAVAAATGSTDGYSLGKPDLIVKMAPYFVGDESADLQGTFPVKISDELLPNDVHVRAWEFRAGTYIAGRETVHHMCGGVRSPAVADNNDQDDDADGEGGASLSLGCIAGGAEATMLPEGFGMELKKGSTVTMNMHYYKQPGPGTGYWNQAEIGFYFAKGPIKYQARSRSIGSTSFQIPPQKPDYRVGTATTLAKDTLILSLWPHGHLRATQARYVATYPDGRQEVLLNVPRYDQSWQVTYKYIQPKLLPKGTRIDYQMIFDNSPERAAKRHFDPSLTVWYGPRTQDEMVLGFMSYAELDAGQAPPSTSGQQQ